MLTFRITASETGSRHGDPCAGARSTPGGNLVRRHGQYTAPDIFHSTKPRPVPRRSASTVKTAGGSLLPPPSSFNSNRWILSSLTD